MPDVRKFRADCPRLGEWQDDGFAPAIRPPGENGDSPYRTPREDRSQPLSTIIGNDSVPLLLPQLH
jgi:hypothetical protein